jgi:aspartyl-tRNA(Asn)/glutamyl-tRNA(Gln) amidotransferase subunit A
MTILEAAAQLNSGAASSAELTADSLAAIKRRADLNAFLQVFDDSATARARQLDAERASGNVRGPLHGIPVAIKDVFCQKGGIATTCGSPLFADNAPDLDAAVVEKLEEAGAVIVGKTHMHELAYGVTSNNPFYGPVRNPQDTTRIPGGSSGGSAAAVAAGLVYMAMGSDTGGSIRLPAAYCGTVGIKPTTGRVSRYGVMPLDFTLDHMGPLTATVRDAAIVLQALAGFDPRDDSSSQVPVSEYDPGDSPDIRGLRLGLPENFYLERIQPDVEFAIREVARRAEQLGAKVIPIRVPDIAGLNATSRIVLASEASALMLPYLHRRTEIGTDTMALLDQGRLLPATDYINAQRVRRLFQREFNQLFQQVDYVLTPTAPCIAPPIGETTIEIAGIREDVRLASTRFVRGINMLGLPALALPCGRSQAENMPLSAQIIGKAFDEAGVFCLARALEAAMA